MTALLTIPAAYLIAKYVQPEYGHVAALSLAVCVSAVTGIISALWGLI
jgi:hypothetical protein